MSFELVTIGCSWGGLGALGTIFSGLPGDFGAAIVVAQHRMAQSPDGLALSLQKRSRLPVKDAEDKEPIEPGRIYLAPPDYHLLVEPGSFALSIDKMVQYARPSIDVLFESAADSYGDKLIGVILTGANEDGAAGLARVKQRGGCALVQDPSTAVRSEMPRAALEAVRPDRTMPLQEIGPYLADVCGRTAGDEGVRSR
ncbi:MAG: chemotaxis protein CheB [Actinomycetota bacterium]|nr:chemotaxis protein CheB [Actinomycetota bacterium]